MNDTVILRYRLVLITLEVAGRVGQIAECLDSRNNVCLLSDHGFAKTKCPIQIFV